MFTGKVMALNTYSDYAFLIISYILTINLLVTNPSKLPKFKKLVKEQIKSKMRRKKKKYMENRTETVNFKSG